MTVGGTCCWREKGLLLITATSPDNTLSRSSFPLFDQIKDNHGGAVATKQIGKMLLWTGEGGEVEIG